MALHRNSEQGWIAGVCAGLAPSSGLPVMLLRIAFILVPVGLPIYLLLWILLPDES